MKKFLVILVCLVSAIFFAFDKTVVYENAGDDILTRIDIKTQNAEESLKIIQSEINFVKPKWCKDCLTGNMTLSKGDDKVIDVKFTSVKKGNVTIALMGQYKKDNNDKQIPLFVDYKDFVVDGENVFNNPVRVWHNEPYKYTTTVKSGQVVHFTVVPQKSNIIYSFKYMHFGFWHFVMYMACLVAVYAIFLKFSKKKVR